MHSVYIGLGSNLGRRSDNIRRALDLLTQDGSRLAAVSSFHETTPVGFTSSHSFLNAAALVLTPLPPEAFLDATQRVERALGRTVKSENGIYHDRTIDIDMLFYDDIVLNTPRLAIPRPRHGAPRKRHDRCANARSPAKQQHRRRRKAVNFENRQKKHTPLPLKNRHVRCAQKKVGHISKYVP